MNIEKILKEHKKWLEGNGGERANLREANLREANLCGADLRGADLREANLCGANLYGANLYGANLYGANLYGANLREANLREANLCGANLRGANLRGANLREANLYGAALNNTFAMIQCPEEGAFVAWKKCKNNIIVKLLIPEDAKRSSATSRKCRASKAKVLEIFGAEKAISNYDSTFSYEKGQEYETDNFDEDRWNECSTGIHFFITRKEAEDY